MSDKIQNLSDAIRMGAALTKPGTKGYLCNGDRRRGEPVLFTCALGAGIYAIKGNEMLSSEDYSNSLEQRFPWLAGSYIKDDESWCGNGHGYMRWYEWVWYQYDHNNMTREQIAKELQEMGL